MPPLLEDESENAGFTGGDPWLPLSSDHRAVNVAVQRRQPASMLSLYRALIALRRCEPALSVGAHVKAEATGTVLSFRRAHNGRRITVALNFADAPQTFHKGEGTHDVLISTHLDRIEPANGDNVMLRANEGIVMAAA